MRGGLVHHTIKIPAALYLLLLRGACSRRHLQYFKITGFVPESPIFSSLQFSRLLVETPNLESPFCLKGLIQYMSLSADHRALLCKRHV